MTNFDTKRQWTKANRFKLIMAGGNGVTRGSTYRKYVGKKYLTVRFSTPEYEYVNTDQPTITFTYGEHTKTLYFPQWTNMTNAELVISGLQKSLSWCADIRVNPKSVAQEGMEFTSFNSFTNK